ncbi:MAG: HNH endonuclease [Planctomycetota bacterium]|jgi:putative restriction endonuclease
MDPFIALTDKRWFDSLASRAEDGRLDEVNFWSPRSTRPIKRFAPGAPFFLRLKRPHYCIAGYGFFAHFSVMSLKLAWETFGWKNGDPDEASFLERIGEYRKVNLHDRRRSTDPIGCTILRDVRFWPESSWLPWGDGKRWARNIVQGKTEDDPSRARLLLDTIIHDHLNREAGAEYREAFELLDADDRRLVEARTVVREGQGAFRARLLDAYGRRCAITGERTEPVLEAAHIQPYLGPRSNHIQNGIVLTREFHTLFDEGLVTIDHDYRVRVSRELHRRWKNGRRYYGYDDRELVALPERQQWLPSREALEWHGRQRFLG